MGNLSGLFNYCTKVMAEEGFKAAAMAFAGAALGGYVSWRASAKVQAQIDEQNFSSHAAVISLTLYEPSEQERGAYNQEITTIRKHTKFSDIFPEATEEISRALDRAAEFSKQTDNLILFQALPHVLNDKACEKTMKTIEDSFKNYISELCIENPNLADIIGYAESDKHIGLFPILTRVREGSEKYRILFLTGDQLKPGAIPPREKVRYETYSGYEVNEDIEKEHSRYHTISSVIEQLNRPESEWIKRMVNVKMRLPKVRLQQRIAIEPRDALEGSADDAKVVQFPPAPRALYPDSGTYNGRFDAYTPSIST